eukprot:268307_1
MNWRRNSYTFHHNEQNLTKIDCNYTKTSPILRYIDNRHNNKQYMNKNKLLFQILNVTLSESNFIYKLPKLIHFIWISNDISVDNDLQKQIQKNIATFINIYSPNGWNTIIWRNKQIRQVFCENYNFFKSENDEKCVFLYNITLSNEYRISAAIKADMLRYLIMERFGGLYFDTDFIAIQSIENLVIQNIDQHGLIVANEGGWASTIMSNGFFASYPNNKCVIRANNKTNIINAMKRKTVSADLRTGPYYWKRVIVATYDDHNIYEKEQLLGTRAYKQYLRNFEISQIASQFPIQYMYPMGWMDKNDTVKFNEIMSGINPYIYAVHLWDGSWVLEHFENMKLLM